jgi:acetoacetyl-CoA synthetase
LILAGSICALATPLRSRDDALDLDAFGRLLDYQREGGTNAMVVAGSTGEGAALDADLVASIGRGLRQSLSPRHVPDTVIAVPAVPTNRTGKKLEVPVKRLIQGAPLDRVVAQDTVADPSVWVPFVELAEERA